MRVLVCLGVSEHVLVLVLVGGSVNISPRSFESAPLEMLVRAGARVHVCVCLFLCL